MRKLLIIWLLVFPGVIWAHDFVLMTGYASSRQPEMGAGVDPHDFSAGGGYAVGARLDLSVAPHVWLAPSFLYWDNITGGQNGSHNSHYAQMQIGARLLVHSWTLPMLYFGGGADFASTRGIVKTNRRAAGFNKGDIVSEFNGDAPVGIITAGFKGPAPLGIGVLAEVSYLFGLDESLSYRDIGPASAVLLQIGVFLHGARH